MDKTTHIGRKISRIREIKGIKQETIAQELSISQQQISRLEQGEEIEEEVLKKIATALGLSTEALRNFNEEAIFNYFNSFHDHSGQGACSPYGAFTFNPIDKIVELYERLLQAEKNGK
ncbi:helix-turn-helix domain-containing protein [Pedobacter glucosidilyticus]|uniref:helix-turn-helix domain-containing protein n=1 Tax=Pedobacter glucosidilyticus TaxID=1122941 RepID=UPI0004795CAC|nr:helix-turn-helix transcriptional regulator [Pedobacter glucosidilyticus]